MDDKLRIKQTDIGADLASLPVFLSRVHRAPHHCWRDIHISLAMINDCGVVDIDEVSAIMDDMPWAGRPYGTIWTHAN